jgi:signal transduction histidine kinase
MTASRILVVEDESIVALHLRQQLIELGYDVPDAVASGDHALHQIEASRPDLVLMDINLKGELDGIATASRIPLKHRIPVIYLTAYADEATLSRASATNPYGYLLKPFHERELHAMIQMALARCRAEHAADHARLARLREEKLSALGQLAGEMADDFDELLRVVYGQLELLGQHAIEYPVMARPIGDAFVEAIEKERLVRRLLAFSGRQKLTEAVVSLPDLIADQSQELRHALGDVIEIRTHLPDDTEPLWIDARQLAKALLDLAANARDAMPDGGILTIEARNTAFDPEWTGTGLDAPSRRHVLLTISDTGSGMPQSVLEQAVEPFYSTKPGADGLGLSMVFGFVRQSGGQISIDSEPDRGTTVRLWLPAAADAAANGESAPFRTEALPRPRRRPVDGGNAIEPRQTARQPGDYRRGFSPMQRENVLPVAWHTAEDTMFASALSNLGRVHYRLIVEPLPRRNGWDWAVWRPGGADETTRHGRASSVLAAMAAAEATARHLAAARSPGD